VLVQPAAYRMLPDRLRGYRHHQFDISNKQSSGPNNLKLNSTCHGCKNIFGVNVSPDTGEDWSTLHSGFWGISMLLAVCLLWDGAMLLVVCLLPCCW
jgi:hypothetical protein